MGDDAFTELSKAGEVSTTNDEVCSIRPQFVEDVASVVRQSIPGFPCAVPCVRSFVVAGNTVFGREQGFSVVFNDAPYGELEICPRIDQGLTAVVKLEFQFAP